MALVITACLVLLLVRSAFHELSGNANIDRCREHLTSRFAEFHKQLQAIFPAKAITGEYRSSECDSGQSAVSSVELTAGWSARRAEQQLKRAGCKPYVRGLAMPCRLRGARVFVEGPSEQSALTTVTLEAAEYP